MCSDVGGTSSSSSGTQSFSATPAASELAKWCCDPDVTSGLPNLASSIAPPAPAPAATDCLACRGQAQRCPDEGCCRVLRAASCCSEPSCSPCDDEACAVPSVAGEEVACAGEVCIDVACGDKPCSEVACASTAGGEARAPDGCLSVCDGFVAVHLPPNEEQQQQQHQHQHQKVDARKRINSQDAARLVEHDGLYGGFNSFQELLDCCCCSELYPGAAASAGLRPPPPPAASVPCGAGCHDVSTCGSTPGASTSASVTTLSRAPSPRPISGLAAAPALMGRGRSMTTTSNASTSITDAASAITAFSASGSSHSVDVDWHVPDGSGGVTAGASKGKEPAHAHAHGQDAGQQMYFSSLSGADARHHAPHQHDSPHRIVSANQFQQPHAPPLHHRTSWTQQLQRGGSGTPSMALQHAHSHAHAHACASAPLSYPPHAHDEQGFCLPPSMTLCDSSGCGGCGESEAAATHSHSHLHAYMHQHNLPHAHPPSTASAAGLGGPLIHSRSLALGQAALPQQYWSPNVGTPTSYAPPWPSPSDTPASTSTWHSPAPATSEHVCQWAGCSAVCSSIAELVSHVHEAHLIGGGSNNSGGVAAVQSSFDTAQMQQKCLWDSCDAHTTAFNTDGTQDEAGVLAHLLSAHLGASQQEQDVAAMLASLHDGSSTTAATRAGEKGKNGRAATTRGDAQPAGKRRKLTRAAQAIVSGATHQELAASPLQSSSTSGPTSRAATPTTTSAGGSSTHACGWQGCNASFPTHALLTEHLGSVHVGNGKAAYECGWAGCERAKSGQTFSQRQKVMRHLQTHTGDRPHQCTECGKRFSEPNTLAQHMRTHTLERPYKCDYPGCDKAFSVAGSLTIHKRIHSGEKPFVCAHCGKRFAESSNLTKHLRVHSGERPFACDICGRAFSRPDQVSRHRKIHTKGVVEATPAPNASDAASTTEA